MYDFFDILMKIVLVISLILSLAIIIFSSLRGKRTLLLTSFVIFQSMFALLCATQLLQYMEIIIKNIFYRTVKYFLMCFTTYGLLVFCLVFINRRVRTGKTVILAVPPFIIFLMKVFAEINLRSASEVRILKFIIHGAYNSFPYIYLVVTAVLLLKYCIVNLFDSRRKSITLVLFISLLIGTGIWFNIFCLIFRNRLGLIHIGNVAAFLNIAISSVIFSVLTLKYRFLNIAAAFKKIVDSLEDAVFFIDMFGKITYYNDSFVRTFELEASRKKHFEADIFCRRLRNMFKISPAGEKIISAIQAPAAYEIQGEMAMLEHGEKHFTVKVQPLFNSTKEALGRVVSFSDISQHKKLLHKISDKNQEITAMNEELTAANEELTALNEQLNEYASTVEELAVARERNRIARDSHDTIGHTMAKLITLLEVCCVIYDKNPEATHEKLNEAVKDAREGMRDIRRSIEGLVPEKLAADNLKTALGSLISDFLPSGIKINLSLIGDVNNITQVYSYVVFRVCQEALTNSLRHGKAENVTIILKAYEKHIELYIFDDGIGCRKIKKGFGLNGMEQRVMDINGVIRYGSDGEKGFNIIVKIPLKGAE